jgi:hypothetical protein
VTTNTHGHAGNLLEHFPARVYLLRGFELCVGPRAIPLASNAQRLVAFLAVRERPQLRVTVAGALWMDAAEDRASANLRTALWKIRSLGTQLIRPTTTHLALDPSVEVDLTTFVAQARRLISPSEQFTDADANPDLLAATCSGLGRGLDPLRTRASAPATRTPEAPCGRLRAAGATPRPSTPASRRRRRATSGERQRELTRPTSPRATCPRHAASSALWSLLWDSLGLAPAIELFRPRPPAPADTTGSREPWAPRLGPLSFSVLLRRSPRGPPTRTSSGLSGV